MKLGKKTCEVIAKIISILGVLTAIFVGGYIFLIRPIYTLYVGFVADTLTTKDFIINIIMVFLAATVAGGIWVIFDMIASIFRDMHGKEE